MLTIRVPQKPVAMVGGPSAGFVLVTVMLLLLILITTVTTALMNSGLQTHVSSNMRHALKVSYIAEAGLQHALLQLGRDRDWRAGIPSPAMEEGTYSVAVNQPTDCDPVTLTATGTMAGTTRTMTRAVTLRYPFRTGWYKGNNSGQSITGVGFQPDVVLVKSQENKEGIGRTSTMVGDASKDLEAAVALQSDRITSFDADGFTVGGNNAVSPNNKYIYWMAWQAVSGTVAVGVYTGDGFDNRTIDISETSGSSDFQPGDVMVFPQEGEVVGQRTADMAFDQSFPLDNGGAWTNTIQEFVANGFVIGDDHRINKSGDQYHYVAWRVVPGHIETGTYVGDGADNRDVDLICFFPSFVIVKSNGTDESVHHPQAIGINNDRTFEFGKAAYATNRIQNLHDGGFEVGTDSRVNSDGATYYWVAFR